MIRRAGFRGSRKLLLAGLAAGLLAFAAGAWLALALLPEWRAGHPRNQRIFRERYEGLAERAGFLLDPTRPRVRLGDDDDPELVYATLGDGAPSWLASTATGLRVHVSHAVRRAEEEGRQTLEIEFSLDGKPQSVNWDNLSTSFSEMASPADEALARSLARLLVKPGESLGPAGKGSSFGLSLRTFDLVGSVPPQHVAGSVSALEISLGRSPGRPGASGAPQREPFWQALVLAAIFFALGLAVIALFAGLLLRARIDLVNGAVLAGLTFLAADPSWVVDYPNSVWGIAAFLLIAIPGRALWVFLVWSAGESLLRSTDADFTTSLDTLRRGRLGPRGGRALLLGFAFGAGLAGLRLALYALAVALPGLSPAGTSLPLPIFRHGGSPVADGIVLAAGAALAFAVASRFLPRRWALPAAALLAGAVLSPVALFPYPLELAANVLLAGLLVWICRRYGLTALLAAAVASLLLPATLFSGLHLDWLAGAFLLTAGLSVLLPLLGFVGLSRPAETETDPMEPPAFMRRLAEERRVRHEVDLLARMQIGLLPREMPRIEGYEIAARSLLASEAGGDLYDFQSDEAGRLWIAAGDVAGHGYSCAIAQAMVKAGFISLIGPDASPSEVLHHLDRVLRGVNFENSFTSLALLRLDPPSGEAALGNAGHPYPLMLRGGDCTEIELPGLPLGQGPPRAYQDRAFTLPPGGALVFCSDGLFEAVDKNGNAYGFDRAREVLRVISHRPAVEMVDALLNDCRRHLGAEDLPDDVTVVAIKRA
jgi:hypothetical protein